MPMTTKGGKVRRSELPGTIRRSPQEAQETFSKAHDSAVETYGEGERAHRVAYAALKHKFEMLRDVARAGGTERVSRLVGALALAETNDEYDRLARHPA